ncbi:MAG TPA: lipid II flippase MurJ [Trebonia sp.]|nr:lipid II flippase MurJ [Trebonia sp.]
MQTDKASLTDAPQEDGGRASRAAELIARGALLIAVLTAMSRMLGLVRTVVFAQSVGAGCLGTAYVTANTVPNLIYELALGGALASAMVPVLARAASRADSDEVQKAYVTKVTSALLTWAVLILLPVTVVIVVAARPIADLLIPANPNATCARPAMLGTTTDLIVAFAPQIILYGVSVVLTGLLQAYRRFTGPTLAPIIGNVVTITSFLVFASLDKNAPLARTPLVAQLVLSIGTTLNIGMLVLVALPPTWRLRLRLRPTFRFPPGVIGKAGGLALVGLLEFVAGDVNSVVTIALANGHGDTGALVLLNYAMLVFASVCSVLPIAIVTSVFPALAAADGPDFDRTCAGSTRAIMLMSWLGTAMIAAVAIPAAHVLAKQPDQVTQLTEAFVVLAPGVAGYALVVGMSRVMFALGRLRAAGLGLVSAPLLQIAVSVPLVLLAPARMVVAALALGSTVALTAVAVPMVLAVRRMRGPVALAGLGHATLAGLVAGGIGGAVGVGVCLALPAGGKVLEAAIGALAALLTLLAFAVWAYALDRGDLRMVAARLRRFARHRG